MFASLTCAPITPDFVTRLAERAAEGERLRRLPPGTVSDPAVTAFVELLAPARYGGAQAPFREILEPVRQMAHGCASSAWTIGFYGLHNWMLALFSEQAQAEAFATAEDVARAFVDLALADKTTAAVLTVDGGNIEAALR